MALSEREIFLWRYDGRGRFFTLSRAGAGPERPVPSARNEGLRTQLERRRSLAVQAQGECDQGSRRRGTWAEGPTERPARGHRDGPLASGGPGEAKRAELRDQVAEAAAADWMARQGATRGFRSHLTAVEGYSTINLGRRRRQGTTLGILDLVGLIEVTSPDVFLLAVAKGFGRAKAWGCGLMLIRRA